MADRKEFAVSALRLRKAADAAYLDMASSLEPRHAAHLPVLKALLERVLAVIDRAAPVAGAKERGYLRRSLSRQFAIAQETPKVPKAVAQVIARARTFMEAVLDEGAPAARRPSRNKSR